MTVSIVTNCSDGTCLCCMLQWLELLGVKEASPGVQRISTEEEAFALALLLCHGITQQVFSKLLVGANTYPHDKREAYRPLLDCRWVHSSHHK